MPPTKKFTDKAEEDGVGEHGQEAAENVDYVLVPPEPSPLPTLDYLALHAYLIEVP